MKGVYAMIDTTLFEQVASHYVHIAKIVQPVQAIRPAGCYLKWYLVFPEERGFAEPEVTAAQAFVLDEIARGQLALQDEVGFVVQHRCTGADILYVCSWRDNNELWETIYSKGKEPESLFAVAHRETKTGTFCVWVIPIVASEQQAWVTYLRSARDEVAQEAYFSHQFDGSVG
jgi:hypothetical protein